jgi:hypothetical protein
MQCRFLQAALCASVAAVSLAPAPSFAGVMPVAEKGVVAPASSVDQVDWRAYPHRHHRWHMGWHYGWPRYRYGMYAGWNPRFAPRAYGYAPRAVYGYAPRAVYGSAAPLAAYAAAAPGGCGVYGAAVAPTCNCCGSYGYGGGGGLFGLGFGGGGLFGLGLGPF